MRKLYALIVILLIGSLISPIIGQAEGSMAYSAKANIPENQINKTLTYFDLKMEPGQEQEISLTVSNSSDKQTTIILSPNSATTNQNGVIDYGQNKGKVDSTLKIPLSSVISKEQEVTLAPNETKQVLFTLKMPDKLFNGILLGGFYVTKKEEAEDSKEAEKNVQIKNNYSYVIGIQLRETLEEVKPQLKMNQIKPALLNYRTAVTVNLQNTEATIIKEFDVHAKVRKKGNGTVLHEATKTDMSMAPNSNFDFPISWDNQSLEPGTYTLEMTAKSGENQWTFEEDFTISAKESKTLNTDAVELEKKAPNWTLIILSVIGAMTLLIGGMLYLIYKHKKKKEAARKARIRMQKRRKKLNKKKSEVEK
ncbi:DUF916 and DUF3324 domain-containing protein [Carnobacterium sp.]|uniref:DUF916 and DUF3324 domain-containing protein n=1 Tax=Carnobacterium sp. TaxID=48221 RepID=UPI002FC9E464